ncbi:MAG: sortase [Patescibacteria group bacterium]
MEKPVEKTPAESDPRIRREKGKYRYLKIGIIIIILAGIGILAYPFIPSLKYALSKPGNTYPYETRLLSGNINLEALPVNKNVNLGSLPDIKTLKRIPDDNRLVIPKIGVDVAIVEGQNEETALLKGAWRNPKTSNPENGGNTVISGHRFRFRPPNNTTFYLLDKLAVGDTFIIYWKGVEYDYQISETKIVAPTAVEILNNTANSQVTLFSCTPLFTTRQRLVVIGQLVEW